MRSIAPATGRFPTCDELLAEARQETGLADFGQGDFREGLGVLLESFNDDADWGPESDARVLADLKRRLVNRLEVEAWYKSHAEIEQLSVAGPIDITGLPRTGTTALANMMSLDPQFRCLRGWEQVNPCPPPMLAEESSDPRRERAAFEMQQLPSELQSKHLYDLDATMEDTDVLGMAFHGQGYTLPTYRYHAWWRGADLRQTYVYHRRVVKLLQSRRPPNLWLFKAPHHKFHFEALVAAYPDVRFVMTHRDPAKVIPSYASLLSSYFPATQKRDMQRLGQEVSNHLRIGLENAIAARARIGDHRFIDVYHQELHANPLMTLSRIYDFLGLDLGPMGRNGLRRWIEVNRPGAHGAHRYSAEQFGLSKEQLRSDYGFYTRRFDVCIED
jgi:Sulfotransferase family